MNRTSANKDAQILTIECDGLSSQSVGKSRTCDIAAGTGLGDGADAYPRSGTEEER